MNDPCRNCGIIDFEDECGFCKLSVEYRDVVKQLVQKDAIIKCLKEAIKYYSDEMNYDWVSFEDRRLIIELDDGKRARAALEEIKELSAQ